MKTFFLTLTLTGLFLLNISAQDDKEFEIGVAANYWMAGDMYFLTDVEKEGGIFLNAYADYNIVPKFAVGAYVNLGPGMKIEGSDRKATMSELGMQLKVRIFAGDVKICPALQIGYRSISVENASALKSDAMALNMKTDIVIPTNSKINLVPSIGFLAQPVGGNDFGDVVFPPIWYIGIGVCF